MSNVVYKCKWCRKGTDHMPVRQTEINGYKGLVTKCAVCSHESAIFRDKGRLNVDQSQIPERTLLMPWDDKYTMMKEDQDNPDSIQANKDIDEWLKNPVGYFPGFGKKGRWGLDSKYHKSEI
jgi:hypothetical protein